jgi:uncharacterized protein (DUF433 family)
VEGAPAVYNVEVVFLRKLREGASEADLVDAYPPLTPDDIRSAMRWKEPA